MINKKWLALGIVGLILGAGIANVLPGLSQPPGSAYTKKEEFPDLRLKKQKEKAKYYADKLFLAASKYCMLNNNPPSGFSDIATVSFHSKKHNTVSLYSENMVRPESDTEIGGSVLTIIIYGDPSYQASYILRQCEVSVSSVSDPPAGIIEEFLKQRGTKKVQRK